MPERNPNRIAAFFPTRREGMLVGRIAGEDLEHLIATIKEARRQRQGLVAFLWVNRPGSQIAASLTVGVDRPREESAPARRPIRGAEGGPRPAPAPPRPDPLAHLFEPQSRGDDGGDELFDE